MKKTKKFFITFLFCFTAIFTALGFVACGGDDESKTPPVTYTVSFLSEYGTPPPTQTVNEGETATEPTALECYPHEFVGWNIQYTSKAYDFSSPVTKNLELRAVWNEYYVVTFDTDGAGEIPSQRQPFRTAAQIPETPQKSGYVFLGWYTPDGTEYPFGQYGYESVTLTAKWEKERKTSDLIGEWIFVESYETDNLTGHPGVTDTIRIVTFTENAYNEQYGSAHSLSQGLYDVPRKISPTSKAALAFCIVDNQYTVRNGNTDQTVLYDEETDSWRFANSETEQWFMRCDEKFAFTQGNYTAETTAYPNRMSPDYTAPIRLTLTLNEDETVSLVAAPYIDEYGGEHDWELRYNYMVFGNKIYVHYEISLHSTSAYGFMLLEWKDGKLYGYDQYYADSVYGDATKYPIDFDVEFVKQN